MNVRSVLRLAVVTTLVGGGLSALAPSVAQGAEGTATVVASWSTSTGAWASIPSPDPSGITYFGGQLVISDGEVEEIPSLYHNVNIYYASLTGVPDTAKFWTTLAWSNEPTGISAWGTKFVVSDDVKKRVFIVNPGSDGRWTRPQDPLPISFATGTYGTDPEDLTVDSDITNDGHIVVISGANKEVVDYSSGADKNFATTGDNKITHFDVLQYGARDPEGIEYLPSRNTLLVLDHTSSTIYEFSRQGVLLDTVSIAGAGLIKAAGMTLAPSSTGTGDSLYVVDRGLDNNTNPGENDGQVVELSVTLPPLPTGDTTPPTITAKAPGANRTGVSRTINTSATFSEPVTNVNASTFTLKGPNGVAVTAAYKLNTGNKWVLDPTTTLAANTKYTATVVGGTGGVQDLSGNVLATSVTWSFTTGAT